MKYSLLATIGLVLSLVAPAHGQEPWRVAPARGPVRPTTTRIVDFGHDFIREGESVPVGQYYLHRWRLKPGASGWTGHAPATIERNIDVDGDGSTDDDSVVAMPLSYTEPLSPIAPWYDRQAGSAEFYGGLVFRFANQPEGKFTEVGVNQEHDGAPHHPRDNWTLFYELYDLDAGYQAHGLYLWLKKDFLLGGDTHRVSFDEDSELSLLLARYYMGFEGCRWVVQNGRQLYVSQTVFRGAGTRPGNGLGKIHTIRPATVRWARYEPREPYEIRFDPDQATFEHVEFDNVRAVGWYLFKDTMEPAYTGFKWYAFEATAVVHRPSRPSEFIAMKEVPAGDNRPAFYASVTEVPYALWKTILRRARSNTFATGPRGFSFDSDGDMGSMDLLAGRHHLDEPVTDVSIYDIATWCNALSAFEMRRPVYYEDAEFTRPLERVVKSPLYREAHALPEIHVRWDADGYRLATSSEWRAMAPSQAGAGDVSDRTSRVGAGKADARGLYGLTDNAGEMLWTFGDCFDPAENPPVLSAPRAGALPAVARQAGRPARHPLVGFRLIRREAGLDAPARGSAEGFTPLPAPAKPEAVDLDKLAIPLARVDDDLTVAQTEVTFGQWRKVYRWAVAHGYAFDADGDMGSMDYWGFGSRNAVDSHGPDEPVTDITLYDAMIWCNALSELNGLRPVYYLDQELSQPYRRAWRFRPLYMTLAEAREANAERKIDLRMEAAVMKPVIDPKADGYRLPAAGEYQRLMRTAGGFASVEDPFKHAWLYDNSGLTTHPVAKRLPAPAKVYDIAGNVSELTEPDPRGPAGWASRFNGGRIGGSFMNLLVSTKGLPRQQPRGVGYPDLGFRVVRQKPAADAQAAGPGQSPRLAFVDPELARAEDTEEADQPRAPLLQGKTFRGNQHRTGLVEASGVKARPRVAWKFDTGGAVRSSPVVYDHTVYVGSEANALLAIDLADGRQRWKLKTDAPVSGSVTIADGTVFVVSEGGTLYAVNAEDGEVRFATEFSHGRPAGAAAVAGRLVLVPSGNAGGSRQLRMGAGPLIGIDRQTGKIVWRGPAGAQGFAAPAVAGRTVYTALGVDQSGAIDLQTRQPRWRYYPGNQDRQWVNPVVLEDRVVIIGSVTGSVNVVDRRTGRRIWRQYTLADQVAINNLGEPGHEILAAPAVTDKHVLVPCNDGMLHGLALSDGSRLWRYDAGAAIRSAPMVASGLAYFGDRSGTLHAVDVETGKGVWKLELGSPIDSSPWPSDARVVVGTDSGHVVAIEQGP